MVSNSNTETNVYKTIIEFQCSTKEEYLQFSEKNDENAPLSYPTTYV